MGFCGHPSVPLAHEQVNTMQVPSSSAESAGSLRNKTVSRTGSPATRNNSRSRSGGSPWKGILLALASIIVGIGIGVLVSRSRNKSREVIVAINGTLINKDDFFSQLERAAGQPVMRKMINDELYVQFAKQKGVAPTEEDILKAYKGINTGAGAKADNPASEVHRALEVSLSEAAVLNKGVEVTEVEVRRFYDQNSVRTNPKSLYFHPAVAQIAVIVASNQAACQAALDAMKKGMTWVEAAKKYSEDASKANGGVLPTIFRTTAGKPKSPQLEDAVFALKIGGQLGPQTFANKWWVIRCLDKKQEVTEPFDKVKEQARMGALLAKGVPQNAKQIEKDFAEFQKKATIQAFWKQYQVTGIAK